MFVYDEWQRTEALQRAAVLRDFGIETAGQPLNYKLILRKEPSENAKECWNYDDFRIALVQCNISSI